MSFAFRPYCLQACNAGHRHRIVLSGVQVPEAHMPFENARLSIATVDQISLQRKIPTILIVEQDNLAQPQSQRTDLLCLPVALPIPYMEDFVRIRVCQLNNQKAN